MRSLAARVARLLQLLLIATVVATVSMSGLAAAGDTDLKAKPTAPKVHSPNNAPESFSAVFETTGGRVVIAVDRRWSPRGADQFYKAITEGFYDDVAFFRVVANFVVQFGLSSKPDVSKVWETRRIDDDPVVMSNLRGTLTYASAGPGTRTTQLFINFVDNTALDKSGFSPVGVVVEGMDVVDRISGVHKEEPEQGRIIAEGAAYLCATFDKLDYIKRAFILTDVNKYRQYVKLASLIDDK
jgi:peptidyl-prolyl cis-trans isomerase A (cyclophilin A)